MLPQNPFTKRSLFLNRVPPGLLLKHLQQALLSLRTGPQAAGRPSVPRRLGVACSVPLNPPLPILLMFPCFSEGPLLPGLGLTPASARVLQCHQPPLPTMHRSRCIGPSRDRCSPLDSSPQSVHIGPACRVSVFM